MLVLASTDNIQVITSSSNALDVAAAFADNAAASFAPGREVHAIAAAATTTVVTAPAASTTRNVSNLSFFARGGANTITPQTTGGTTVQYQSIALAAGEKLEYENGKGWNVFDASGQVKYAVASGGSAPTGTGFRHMTAGVEDAAAKLVDTADVNADQITNALLANMNANTVKVEATGSASNPQDLAMGASTILARLAAGNIVAATVAQTLTLLGAFSSVNLQAFTASGTYTPTSGMKFCLVITTGSGGGGGGADNNAATAGFVGIGGGGGAGGTCVEIFSAATIGASQAVTIGTAGAGGSATNGTSGTAGGNSTFGALHTANGGAGGTGSGLSAVLGQVSAGGAGGVPTGGLLNSTGGDGEDGWAAFYDSAGTDIKLGRGGDGGASFWGGGGKGNASVSLTATGSTAVTSAGTNGKAFGSGGSGAYCSTSITGAAGGTGAAGACLVVEFI